MTARAGRGFEALIGGSSAEVAAVDFAAGYRSDDGTVTRIVTAFDWSFLHRYGQGAGAGGLFEISTLKICAAGSPGVYLAKYVLSNGSVMQSIGETNWGSTGPPTPIESAKVHTPWPVAWVTNALNVHLFEGLALGEGDGDAIPRKIDFCASREN